MALYIYIGICPLFVGVAGRLRVGGYVCTQYRSVSVVSSVSLHGRGKECKKTPAGAPPREDRVV